MKAHVNILAEEFVNKGVDEILHSLNESNLKIAFSTSFGKEDQIITDFISKQNSNINLFTLDTGRLFEQTYEVFQRTILKYNLNIETYFPNQDKLQELVSKKGPLSFYDSIENRKECCAIRKIEPLNRALEDVEVWVTGLRKAQSENRNSMQMVEWDESRQLIKVHPLFFWTDDNVDKYISKNNVPINSLHKKGFPSIGCSPCTRAIEDGEDARAGRWWWENSKKECGLHS